MEVVKNLSEDELDCLREDFEKNGENEGLPVDEFAEVLKKAAVGKKLSDDAVSVERLHDLFNEIDFNGDTRVSWEEFTMFIIDTAMKKRYEGDEKIRKYVPIKVSRIPVGDTQTGGYSVAAEVRKLRYYRGVNQLVKVSTFGNQHRLKLIDPVTFKGLRSTPKLQHPVVALEMVPEHGLLIVSSAGLQLQAWDVSPPHTPDYSGLCGQGNSEEELTLKRSVPLPESQMALKWCSRYNLLFSASRTGSLHYWNVEKMDVVRTEPRVHDQAILDLLVIDQEVITASLDTTIKIRNLERNVCTGVLRGHSQGVCALAFSKQHQFLISAGFEYDPLVWVPHIRDFHPWRLTDKQQPHRGTVMGLFTVPDTPRVITADCEGIVKIWDIRTFEAVQTICPWQHVSGQFTHARSNLFSAMSYIDTSDSIVLSGPRCTFVYKYEQPSNHDCADDAPVLTSLYTVTNTIITVHKKGIKVWDEDTGLIQSAFDDLVTDEITSFCMCNRGRKFFVGTLMGKVSGYVMSSGHRIQSMRHHRAAVTCLCYGTGTRGHKFIVSVSQGGSPPIYINGDGEESASLPATALNFALQGCNPTFCAVSHANSMLIVGTTTGRILCSDTGTFALTHVFESCAESTAPDPKFTSTTPLEAGTGCEGEIFALCVLGTLPVLAVGDSSGHLYLWTMRPYAHPRRLLAKWMNVPDMESINQPGERGNGNDSESPRFVVSRGSASSGWSTTPPDVGDNLFDFRMIPTSLAYHQNHSILYVGDDKGYVAVYCLAEALARASVVSTKFPHSSEISQPKPRKLRHMQNMPLQRSWKAHDAGINTIQVVVSEHRVSILTAGDDLKVHMWSTSGIEIASLCQGREREKTVLYSRTDVATTTKRHELPVWNFKTAETDMDTLKQYDGIELNQTRSMSLGKTFMTGLDTEVAAQDTAVGGSAPAPSKSKGLPRPLSSYVLLAEPVGQPVSPMGLVHGKRQKQQRMTSLRRHADPASNMTLTGDSLCPAERKVVEPLFPPIPKLKLPDLPRERSIYSATCRSFREPHIVKNLEAIKREMRIPATSRIPVADPVPIVHPSPPPARLRAGNLHRKHLPCSLIPSPIDTSNPMSVFPFHKERQQHLCSVPYPNAQYRKVFFYADQG
ncbi:Katanin p80 WD40 repeat-containing subunit B1-like protein [Diplonema papillatum]|nr:Katanin p80 WD40 repeat-containing subunit B1-like protein [Diplonema papillatum]